MLVVEVVETAAVSRWVHVFQLKVLLVGGEDIAPQALEPEGCPQVVLHLPAGEDGLRSGRVGGSYWFFHTAEIFVAAPAASCTDSRLEYSDWGSCATGCGRHRDDV